MEIYPVDSVIHPSNHQAQIVEEKMEKWQSEDILWFNTKFSEWNYKECMIDCEENWYIHPESIGEIRQPVYS